jgi:hypothetical protein
MLNIWHKDVYIFLKDKGNRTKQRGDIRTYKTEHIDMATYYPTEATGNRVPGIRILFISSSAVHPAWQQRR